MQRRDRGIAQSLGIPLIKKVKGSRVLLVGAGGIGCELLKNLVCCGFGSYNPTSNGTQDSAVPEHTRRRAEVVVIDLDTIDLSNLNRQFLFRKHHIKKPKATVAKETASQFNPAVNIEAHHANIFDSKYNVEFFESFDVVFNALDNLAARRHVNKMCLAANVPLIESGTTGFNGQVQAIKKGVTECYDCNPKPVQKSFPICTIRSTPSQPIHCIVWAKSYLFPELFGTSEEDSADMSVTEGDNAEEVAKLKEEAEALKKIRSMMGRDEFAAEIFNKVFHDDIERLRSMEEMWQNRKPPDPLKFEALAGETPTVKEGQALALQDQRVWTLLENISVFCYSLEALSKRALAGEIVIEFDKDDKDTLNFVASAANLRSHIFAIQLHSEWEIKQMAGNIIPAIASSNALTASLCVLEAFKILRSQTPITNATSKSAIQALKSASGTEDALLGGAKTVFLVSKSTDRLITPQSLAPPKPDCPVCSPFYAKLLLPAEESPKLQDLVDLLKARVGYEEFSITMNDTLIYDPDLEDNLDKSLGELGVDGQSNGFLTVMDDDDVPKVDLILSTSVRSATANDNEVSGLRLIPNEVNLPLKPRTDQSNGELNGEIDPELEPVPYSGQKRKRETEHDIESAKKKVKADGEEVVYVVEDDGAILLDD